MKVHAGEVTIDTDLVGGLVAMQFPELGGLPVSRVRSAGTVNAITGSANTSARDSRA